ncbi:glycosyltransferase family 2 protein [Natrialba sp. SSL1]|uniref:glycosyltransferase family 2 protein n=1 Tax=Natrialba sp. SSL1 TaxID=1869245 RepID=UPI0008F87BCC|nr:glycosyltransferase family 2 protein [Natrialba sp. SSL1]OIB56119.1 hypothetical protein BBD46_19740 [Natrialba sp. SSL1]
MTRISIILPAYNENDVLSRAISSVLEQTFEDWELIVVDDSSTDSTPEIANSFTDDRIRLYQHHTNRGGSAARNTGIINATGEYISFLDADDEWWDRKLDRQLTALTSAGDDVVATYCDITREPPSNSIIKCAQSIRKTDSTPVDGGDELIPYILSRKFGVGGSSTLLIKSEIVREIGGFNPLFKRHQDYEFLIRVLQRGEILYQDEILVTKHQTGSVSPETIHDAKEQLFESFEAEIRDAEEGGFDVVKEQKLALARSYASAGDYDISLKLFSDLKNKNTYDYIRFIKSLTRT